MAVAGRSVYFVYTPVVAKNYYIPVTGLLDTGAQANLTNKDVLPVHCLLKMLKPTTKDLFPASERPLESLEQATLHLRIFNRFTIIPLFLVEKLAIDVVPGTTSIDEHKLAIPPDQRQLTVYDCNWLGWFRIISLIGGIRDRHC